MQWVASRDFEKQVAQDIVDHTVAGTHSGALDGAKVALFTGAPGLSPTTKFSDLVEANFDGYAESAAIVWAAPMLDGAGNWTISGDAKQFLATDGTVGNIVTGIALFTGVSPNQKLMLSALLDTPAGIALTGNGITVLPVVQISGVDWGAPVTDQ